MKDKIELFSLCFGDSVDSVRKFFSIEDITTLTEYTNDELVAMASLVPLKTESGATGFYAYGVCVHPKHRGKGAFRRIMSKCEAYANEKDADFICLIPADARLSDTYMRMGYTEMLGLSHNAKEDSEKIFVLSDRFIEYATPESNEKGAVPYGLMKPFSIRHERKMAFFSPMGDC